jgi:peroxiredoxin
MNINKGEKAPDFSLQDTAGNERSLYELLGDKKGVLLFFPLAFSSTCTEEMCTMRDNMKLYNALNAVVIGISIDSFFTLKEYKKANNLNFPLLSDFNREVAKTYGVLYDDYFGMKGVAKRASFVIGRDKKVIHYEILEESGNLPDFEAIQSALG